MRCGSVSCQNLWGTDSRTRGGVRAGSDAKKGQVLLLLVVLLLLLVLGAAFASPGALLLDAALLQLGVQRQHQPGAARAAWRN
jgi:hypothetical protein